MKTWKLAINLTLTKLYNQITSQLPVAPWTEYA